MKKYFETKDGSLEAVSTKIAKEQPTIKKEEPNVKLERKTYFENKPGSLEDLASKVVSEGLDPVNKDAVKKKFADRKDKDIDNDGDVDSSDKFLHKRRKAISKAVKEAVKPDDKGEIINKKKHDAYGDPKKGETKPVDPEPKISQIIKGEKETTRANGHMTKKKFSEMRMKLGQKGKTETGKEAPVIDTEPKAEKI